MSQPRSRLRRFLMFYGGALIFLWMWIGSALIHYTSYRETEKHEAETRAALVECVRNQGDDACENFGKYDEDDFRTAFRRDTFENHQSEYAQLFWQTLVIGYLGDRINRKMEERSIRMEKKINRVMIAQGLIDEDEE